MSRLPSANRFDSRVCDYVRWRPDYPAAAIELLVREIELRPGRTVADIGAGTGILTRALLATGATVHAIEPNERMRAAAASSLGEHATLTIADGAGEATGLAHRSVDAITIAQAMHWIDPVRGRVEFRRVLRPGGRLALLWNTKPFDSSPFLAGYRQLLADHAPEYDEMRHETLDDVAIAGLYGAIPVRHVFPHAQFLNWEGVRGRVLSASYIPQAGESGHEAMLVDLRDLFDAHAADSTLTWQYETVVHIGRLA